MNLQTGIFSGLLESERAAARDMAIAKSAAVESRAEYRTSLENPQTPLSFPAEWLLDIWNGGRTDSGIRVSELTALQVSDVFACVDSISSAIASRPIKVFERLEVGGDYKRHAKRLAIEHPLFDLLRYEPNEEMTSFVFFKTLQSHALLWGNAYAEIQRDNAARIVGLWPRNPARTRPVRVTKTGTLVYKTTEGINEPWYENATGLPERIIPAEDMVFIPGLSLDGRIGQGVVWLARQVLGIALAAEKYAAKFFANGATPGGILTHPGVLTAAARETAKRSWMEAQGGENIHRVALLEQGLAYTKIGSTPSEAQMIEARKEQRSQVAAIYHYPITMLGETGVARANAEQVALEFVNYTLYPWIECWQQELKRKVLNPPTMGRNAGRSFIVLIDTRSLTLPDAKSKQGYYTSMRQWTWGVANDVREMEDLNPIEGEVGEGYLVPVNMSLVRADGSVIVAPVPRVGSTPNPAGNGSPATESKGKKEKKEEDSLRAALWPIFRDAFGRFATRKEHTLATAERIFRPVLAPINSGVDCAGIGFNGQLRRLASLSDCDYLPERVNEVAENEWRLIWAYRSAHVSHLYLARHGATDHTDSELPDHTGDYPLNNHGLEQVASLANYTAGKLPKLAMVAGPDLKRNVETMQALGGEMRIDTALTASEALSQEQARALVNVIEGYRAAVDAVGPTLLVLSHHAIQAYVNSIRGGSAALPDVGAVGCCSLWAVDRDGKDAKLIFEP